MNMLQGLSWMNVVAAPRFLYTCCRQPYLALLRTHYLFYAWFHRRDFLRTSSSQFVVSNFFVVSFVSEVRACVRTIEHCIEVRANRCQYNSVRIHGFAVNIEDDITQLDVRWHAYATHACGGGWRALVVLRRQGRAHKGEARRNRMSKTFMWIYL